MRKALVVGIDHYAHLDPLFGCVNDAHAVANVIERDADADAEVNFDVNLITASNNKDSVSRGTLRTAIVDLFADESEIALFYFAGHGHRGAAGVYLCSSDCESGDDGVALVEVLKLANDSKARNKVLLLDSCYSGMAGNSPLAEETSALTKGLTILTAGTADQYANEERGHGVFTELLVDALNGGAANLVGKVTPGSVYAHIDQSLGPWGGQRPVFKTNVHSFVSLRSVKPPIALADLKRIVDLFPEPGFVFQLDPTFEPARSKSDDDLPAPDEENTKKFAVLQKYNRVNLLIPVDAPHMYYAAMHSKSCKLTVLGEHYRRLVKTKRI